MFRKYTIAAMEDRSDSTCVYQQSTLDAHQHNAAAPAPFRFHDLPEELQARIVRECLTDWSYIVHSWRCRSCAMPRTLPLTLALYRVAHLPKPIIGSANLTPGMEIMAHEVANSYYAISTTSMQLVDRNMRRHCKREMVQKFTGHLYISEDVNNPNLEDCWCKGVHQASADIPNTFSSVHCETDRGFYEFRTLFLQIPPNMELAVARCKETLFDGPTYGFGEESFFVRVVSEEKLKALMLSKMQGWKRDTAYYWSLKDLWGAGVRTIVEMVVAMGSPPMRFEFMCIFLLKDFDADPVVLGKFTMQEWRSSVRLQMSIYKRDQ